MTQQMEVVDRKPAASGKSLMQVLETKKAAMAAVATKHLSAEKLLKIVATAMSRVPKLTECTPLSVAQSLMTCAEIGLAPGTLGSVYLVPFFNSKARAMECQLIIGYRGLVELARRSGELSTVQAEVVREGDEFVLEFGLEAKFKHIPLGDPTRPIVKVWAMATFKDGGHQLAVMSKSEVDKVRNMSKAGQFGPWKDHYEEMAKKTAIRRLCKLLPLTPELEEAIAAGDKSEFDFDIEPPAALEAGEEVADPAKSAVRAAATKAALPAQEPAQETTTEAPATTERPPAPWQHKGKGNPPLTHPAHWRRVMIDAAGNWLASKAETGEYEGITAEDLVQNLEAQHSLPRDGDPDLAMKEYRAHGVGSRDASFDWSKYLPAF